ncbi:hypothetical protein ACFQ6N_38910 [Kitasatospora sp. NPDC056446]|uniref:hypothetical protein n=1 Tax=Kitasatospora sp. NPDC056446 TaxID=3345819 RepID=UPI0036C40C10
MIVRRGSAFVVVEVEWGTADEPDLKGWTEGPLPVALGDGAADRARRMTYFEPRVAESLYGSPQRPARWHRALDPDGPGPAVEAVELLRLPAVLGPAAGHQGLAVLHVRLSPEPLTDLPYLADPSRGGALLAAALPPGARLPQPGRRPWTLCHVTFAAGSPPEAMPAAYAAWGARDQWLWLLASATPLERFPPDPQDDGLFAGRVRFSADWQALVLRDGAAFVGTSPDPGGDAVFHAGAAALVRTIYLDTFLLGRLQVLGLNRLANAVAGLHAHEADGHRLLSLERRAIELRRALWSSHITTRAKANELLERFQEQHRLPDLLTATGTALADAARYVETARSRRGALALGLISAVGLPFGLAYSAGALWGAPSPLNLLVCTLAALAATALAFTLLPPLRGLAAGEARRRERAIDDPRIWED